MKLFSPSTGASLCLINMHELFQKNITYQTLVDDYIFYARASIQPSSIVESCVPENIEHAVGIHLRRSDKIVVSGDLNHETHVSEYDQIISRLKHHLRNVVKYRTDKTAYFYVCSEDHVYKKEFMDWLNETCCTFDDIEMMWYLRYPRQIFFVSGNHQVYGF